MRTVALLAAYATAQRVEAQCIAYNEVCDPEGQACCPGNQCIQLPYSDRVLCQQIPQVDGELLMVEKPEEEAEAAETCLEMAQHGCATDGSADCCGPVAGQWGVLKCCGDDHGQPICLQDDGYLHCDPIAPKIKCEDMTVTCVKDPASYHGERCNFDGEGTWQGDCPANEQCQIEFPSHKPHCVSLVVEEPEEAQRVEAQCIAYNEPCSPGGRPCCNVGGVDTRCDDTQHCVELVVEEPEEAQRVEAQCIAYNEPCSVGGRPCCPGNTCCNDTQHCVSLVAGEMIV